MQSQQVAEGFIVRLDSGEPVVETLTRFLRERGTGYAVISAIGAVRLATLAYWNAETRRYEERQIREQMEVASLSGTCSLKEGEPFLHLHGVFGRRDQSVVGGHLREAVVNPTLEVWLRTEAGQTGRERDEATGLHLLNLSEASAQDAAVGPTERRGEPQEPQPQMGTPLPEQESVGRDALGGQAAKATLSAGEHRRKEQILTQPEPSKVRDSIKAVVLKHGSLFLLTTEGGDIPWGLPHGLGLFYEDCRYLDGYTLSIDGQPLTVLSSIDFRGYETYHDLANPLLRGSDGRTRLERNTIAVRRERLIRGNTLHELMSIRNYGATVARFELVLRFRSSFEDIFILKGFVQDPRGTLMPARVIANHAVELRYQGQDGFIRTTRVTCSLPPDQIEPGRMAFHVSLEPGEDRKIALAITPSEHRPDAEGSGLVQPGKSMDGARRWMQRHEQIWLQSSADINTPDPLFNKVLRRSLLDLRMLRSRLGSLRFFAAGIPWFATLFGRDACIVAIQTMPYGQAIARETLQLLARYQATEVDKYRDAEPGKILHEFRTGELSHLGEIPQSPAYYGTVDATILFLILMSEYANWSGDLDLARKLIPNIEAALGWVERYADHNGDGYVDYVGEYANGLVNQGWKDSGNAIVNADGSLARPPIALCEVQAYLYRAWRQTAALMRTLGEAGRARVLERRAEELRARFDRDFWSEDLGCYVLALQDGGRPARVVTSNTGQVLWGGIAAHDKAARVVQRLLQPDMFSGWGIRTLSSNEVAYNPISYHLGSVWPHDNGLMVAGFRRYGEDEAALRVFGALFDAAASLTDYRMPELYCGYERREGEQQPVRYPVACSPQAWAAGALPHALWNLLGLRANALEGSLRVIHPCLPEGLEWLELSSVRVGQAVLDLRFERLSGRGVRLHTNLREGQIRVEVTPDFPEPGHYT